MALENIKKEKFSKSISYLFISQGLIKVLGLVYSLYLINKPCFGDKGNAIYLSGYQVFVFMLTFSSIGVPNAISNYVAKSNNHIVLNKIFKSAIIIYVFIATISSIILFLFSNIIATNILGIDCISYNLKLLSPIIIITTLESIYTGFFNGIKQMKITAKVQFIEQLFKTFFTIAIVELISKKTNDPEILSIGATLGVAISIMISFVICYFEKKKVSVYAKDMNETNIRYKDVILKLLKFSIPISIGAMLIGINKNCDSFTVMNVLANKIGTQEAQKIYGIIASKVDVLILLPMAFNITFSTALIPNISEAKKRNDYRSIKFLIENAIFMSMAIGVSSFLGLSFFSEKIFDLLFVNSTDGAELLKIASFSIIFSILNQTFIGILQGFEKNKISVIASFWGTIVKISLNVILVNQEIFYRSGIIFSSIISNMVMCLITYKEVRKNIKFSLKRYLLINLISGIIMIYFVKLCYKILLIFKVIEKISFIISVFLGIIVFLIEMLLSSYFFGFLKSDKKRKI